MTLKTVGVLGGMGPAATVDFMDRLLKATAAPREQDNLRLIVDCNPHVPDRNHLEADGPQPGPVLAGMAHGLEVAGAEFVVMACNTAHIYEADIRGALQVPFVSLIAETARVFKARHPTSGRAGLLATTTCIDAKLYQDALKTVGVETLTLDSDGLGRFMTLLYEIKRGNLSDASRAEMRSLADLLIATGAEVIVAGCTEVPLVLSPGDIAKPLVDTTEVLVERTLAYARDGEVIPLS